MMMMPFEGPIAVTGATGFIGRNLCDHFRRRSVDVRAMVRDTEAYPFAEQGIRTYRCVLPDTLDEGALAGATALVHCAYITRHRDLDEAHRVNDVGTRRVLEASRKAGVTRFVFFSSQSAHDQAESYYGRSKLRLERLADAKRDLILRPGLVLGPGRAGLFERMCETVRSSKVIPLFGGGHQPLQTVHIDDLCASVGAALDRNLTGLFTVADADPVPIGRFLRLLAAGLGKKPFFVPFPLTPALIMFRTLEALHIPFPVSSENLLGLKQMRAVDTRADQKTLGVSLRSTGESLRQILRHSAA